MLIYEIFHITSTFPPFRLLKPHKWPAPHVSSFIAQLVRASHRYRSWVQTLLKSRLFAGFYIRKSVNCFHNCKDYCLLDFTSAVQYLKYFTYNSKFNRHGLLRTNKWPAPNVSGFIAQLVGPSHRCRRVIHSNPLKVLTFCRLLYRQLHKLLS